jgi:integrase
MSVLKRGKIYYLRIRPFRDLINVRTSAKSKSGARQMEMAVLTACRSGDYRALHPETREVCVRMFRNQGWELPADLAGNEPVKHELSLWRGMEIFLNYPEIKQSAERNRYVMCFAHLVEHFGKDRPVKDIRIPHIKEYMVIRASSGMSPSQVNREKGTLSKMFQVLTELQYVEGNPCRLIKNLSQKTEERQVYLSLDDVSRIAECCPGWFRSIIWTSFYTGMRRGEIVGLTRKQVNLGKRMIYLGPGNTKERDWKRVPIRRDLVTILEEALRISALGSDKVFLLQDDKGLRPPTLEAVKNPWPRACQRLEIEKPWPRFHDLRHTWRANARRSGVDPSIAESILGHWYRGKSVNERYGHISDHELLQAIDSITFDHGETEIWVTGR